MAPVILEGLVRELDAHFVRELGGYVQVTLAAHDGFIKLAEHFQGVAKVTARLGFS